MIITALWLLLLGPLSAVAQSTSDEVERAKKDQVLAGQLLGVKPPPGQLGLLDFFPKVGPLEGGSQVLIHGVGIQAVEMDERPPKKNKFEVKFINDKSEQIVDASVVKDGVLKAVSPPFWAATSVNLAVSVNGGVFQYFGGGNRQLHYFDWAAQDISPSSGPLEGKTNISLSMPELEGRFRDAVSMTQVIAKFEGHNTSIPFTTKCFVDGLKVMCVTPRAPAIVSAKPLQLYLSNDGGQFWIAVSGPKFTYYAVGCKELSPRSGPVSGDTQVQLGCRGLLKTGTLVVKFSSGQDEQLVKGQLVEGSTTNASAVYAIATIKTPAFPRHTIPEAVTGKETFPQAPRLRTMITVSLNGQQWHGFPFEKQDYIYYDFSVESFSPKMKMVPTTLRGSQSPTPAQNFEMHIQGSGFFVGMRAETVVRFDPLRTEQTKSLKSITVQPMVLSDTELLLNPPFYQNGTFVYASVALNGQQFMPLKDLFYYYSVEVTNIWPRAGAASGGTVLTIDGKGFLDKLGPIRIGLKCEDSFTTVLMGARISDSQVLVTTPEVNVGLGAKQLICGFGMTFDETDFINMPGKFHFTTSKFTALGTRHILGLMQRERASQERRQLIIKGSNIVDTGNLTIRFFNKSLGISAVSNQYLVKDPETLVVTMPPLDSILGVIDSQQSNGGLNVEISLNGEEWQPVLNYTSNKYRRLSLFDGSVTDLYPKNGPAVASNIVTLVGSGFHTSPRMQATVTVFNTHDNSLRFRKAVQLTIVNRTMATMELPPAGLPRGIPSYAVFSVSFSGDGDITGLVEVTDPNIRFNFYDSAFKTMSPSSGPVNGGTVITINGTAITQTPNAAVRFVCNRPECGDAGAQLAAPAKVLGSSSIQTIAPTLSIPTKWGVEIALNGMQFQPVEGMEFQTFDAKLLDLEPKEGPVEGRTQLLIKGSSLPTGRDLKVRLINKILNQKPMQEEYIQTVQTADPTQLRITTPSWVDARAVEVQVSLNGQQFTTSPSVFKYYVPTAPIEDPNKARKPFEYIGHAFVPNLEPPSED